MAGNLIKFHHVVVIADKRTLSHLNLNQPALPNFVSKQVDKVDELAQVRLHSVATDTSRKAIFVGIGNYDASNKTGISNFESKLKHFFHQNHDLIKYSDLVFIKPRVKKEYSQMEKHVFAEYIGVAYAAFLHADPNTTLLSMDKKPKLVSTEYKLLFRDLFVDSTYQSSKVHKEEQHKVKAPDTSSSSSSSSTEELIPVNDQPVYRPSDRSRPSNDAGNVRGRYVLFFNGMDFVSSCTVKVEQNGKKVGETEKYDKKDNGNDPFFAEGVAVDFDHNPQNHNLQFVFGDWGHLNITMSDILAKDTYQVHAFGKKNVKAKVSIMAMRESDAKTKIQLNGVNLKKMDLMGKTDAFFKVYVVPQYKQDQGKQVYTSEVVDNDLTPQWKAFELNDGRFNMAHDRLLFEFYDKDPMSSSYMGKFDVGFQELKHWNARELFNIIDDKNKSNGQIMANINQHGTPAPKPAAPSRADTRSYRIYMSCTNLEKETNQITYKVNGKESKTEKITKTNNPGYATFVALDNITLNNMQQKKDDFTIEFHGTKKETAMVSFNQLLGFVGGKKVNCEFGGEGGLLWLQMMEVRDDIKWTVNVAASKLPVMDSMFEGKATDPYFKFYVDECPLYVAAHVKQTLNADWKFELPACRIRESQTLMLEFFDHDMGGDDEIGYLQVETHKVLAGHSRDLGLMPMGKKQPKGLDKTKIGLTVLTF